MTETDKAGSVEAAKCGECHRPDPVLTRGYNTPKDRGSHDTRDPDCYYAKMFQTERDKILLIAEALAAAEAEGYRRGREEGDRWRAALVRLQQWDELNPPNKAKIHDAPRIKQIIDDALADAQEKP